MWLSLVSILFGALLLVSASTTSHPTWKRASVAASSKFITTAGDGFELNGKPFKFVGTNVYWLPTLNSDQDIDNTFAAIKAANITVVRLWAFNDVDTIPVDGVWFSLIANDSDTVTVNTGPNGLQRLDKVVQLAEQHGIFLILSLTNNWNPRPLLDNINDDSGGPARRDVTSGTGNSLPRNVLSNDYGGMDSFVRRWGTSLHHDEFYTNEKILGLFQDYTTQVISRYVNSPAILGWETANDPRCNSSIPSTADCTTQTITKWTATMSNHIRSVDPNHLVSSGNGGFYCLGCTKLFPLKPPPPPPAKVSPAPRVRRRPATPLSPKEIQLEQLAEYRRRKRELKIKSSREPKRPAKLARTPIRGRWKSTTSRRQDEQLGPSFDGSHGIDSEDIFNIPGLGFSTFQLFPDLNQYAPVTAGLDPFNATIQVGLDWIQRHIADARTFGKPIALTSFGLVTVDNNPAFVPFNKTVPVSQSQSGQGGSTGQQPFRVTDDQRNEAYGQWLKAGLQGGINGMTHYQWGQSGLTGHSGTTISSSSDANTASPNQNGTGVSPNDGYSISGTGEDAVQQVLSDASQQFAADTS